MCTIQYQLHFKKLDDSQMKFTWNLDFGKNIVNKMGPGLFRDKNSYKLIT